MKWILSALCFSFFICCSDNSSSPQNPFLRNDKEHAGMVFIKASDSLITLGSIQTVEFTYDFSIDKHEVTCGEYAKFIKNSNCENSEIPVTNVTFFDAILFANEKSKNENLDTAYSYTDATFDSEGHCTSLAGYAFHAEADAYRLPTEAEWVLAASQKWDPEKSWNAENSDFILHKPCTVEAEKKSNFCDFAGNAMEWVNDWMGVFHDTTIANYVGAPDGGNIGERIVKGGSYRNAIAELSIDKRGDIYTVTSSTKADYVGFRLAFGKIPNAVWISNTGKISTQPISVVTSSAQLKKFTGTYHNKLVFRNDETGNIAYINFANGIPRVREIEDSIDAYHPALSPDGKFVAFSTKYEGIPGKSELYVRSLNADDTNKIKLDVKSAAIPRWRIVDADTEIVYVTSADVNSDEASWKKASTWSVPFTNGKFGTPKKLFDGTFNGGVSADGKLAVSGARLLRVNKNGKNETWYNKEQACNASFSDSTKQTLFLDFSGNTGKKFSGKKYATHEQILIADSTGKLVKMIPAPKGNTFDHTEWVQTNRKLATATLSNADGAHPQIVLVSTRDSSTIEMVNGAELWHPDLWTGKRQNFETTLNIDSAGMYELNNPFTGDLSPMNTRYDLELLFKYRDSINVLISGSSRSWNGIDPLLLNKSKAKIFSINTANAAVDLSVAKKIMLNYGVNFLPKLKIAVVSLDLDILFWRHKDMANFWNLIYLTSIGFVYDQLHDFWPDGYPKGLYELTRDSYGENEDIRKEEHKRLGHKYAEVDGWNGSPVHVDTTQMDDTLHQDKILLEEIEEFIKEAEAKNIYLIGVIFPQSPGYKETGAFGRYGLRRSVATKMIKKLHKFEETYPHFRLMDENKMGDHDYDDEMAINCDHLSYKGAEKLTKRLDSLIQTLPTK